MEGMDNHVWPRILVTGLLILLVGCDPGMTVRRINSVVESEGAPATPTPQIAISVKTTHQLIGEPRYDPQVTAANLSDAPVTITGVELVSRNLTFQNRAEAQTSYPLNLPAHSTVPIDVHFHFNSGVYVIFKDPVELQVHYSSRQGKGVARVTLARGHLNDE